MGSTFSSLHHHIVIATKNRRPLIKPDWRPQLHQYLGGAIRGLGAVPQIAGGVEDHVHLLIGLTTSTAPADLVRELKKASSGWASKHHDSTFSWQEGYGIFSVSWSHCGLVRKYIANQEEHHRRVDFLEEYKRLLKRNGIAYNPKWLE
jgi:putative transposase